ncbi:MAG: site-2 protease family protein [Parcubacteria group bacterium]|nr:site-2 protease family protein [Parcubacteria group bacterium]
MIITILIVLISLIILVFLHELGHFYFAKKFGVEVEELGIGYPPRIWGKKIKGTIYSINLLLFGAFVKIKGFEDQEGKDPASFSAKPLYQRAIILVAGVVIFWIVAILIFSFVVGFSSIPTAVPDDFEKQGVESYVQIYTVADDSPAQEAGIIMGDEIISISKQAEDNVEGSTVEIDKVKQVQEFTSANSGEQISLLLRRGKEEIEISLVPRIDPPSGEGAMGIGLVRVANLETVWYKAPVVGWKITVSQTKAIPTVMIGALVRKIKGEKVTDVQIVSPVGVVQIMGQALQRGVGQFFMFMGMIAVWLALFNLLPIPALDGGRLLFLLIEWIRGKPVSHKIEQAISGVFMFLLIALMIVLTVRDVIRLF